MDMVLGIAFRREEVKFKQTTHQYPEKNLTYLGNILNKKAEEFYKSHGVVSIEPALEYKPKDGEKIKVLDSKSLMYNKFCLRFELGSCPKKGNTVNLLKDPLYLVTKDKKLRLDFDCKACEMKVIEES
jgi:putative protease